MYIYHGVMSCVYFKETRKGQLMKTQLEMYKRQVQEFQIKMSEETKRADKAEFENTRQQEKMGMLQREKEVGQNEHKADALIM